MSVQDPTWGALPRMTDEGKPISRFRVLGVRVDAVQIPDVVAEVERWITLRDRCRYIAVTGMHGVSESQNDAEFKMILNSADLVVPDGMPLVWLGRRHGYGLKRRVYGPEFMQTFCEMTGPRYRHFFYGGAEGVADELADVLRSKFGIEVAGTYCPPFRPLTEDEEAHVKELVQASAADILWVGLSTPKQERWMYSHRLTLPVPVMVGVGAAFDLNSGNLDQAPRWMRENGLEWFYRLYKEPRRLWRRYIVQGSKFVWNVSLELLGLKVFD
jgi:N-acetylglucosaminyldiphosphoundecaprenol N-acetyl-beta-D-mannosaminyltransferase